MGNGRGQRGQPGRRPGRALRGGGRGLQSTAPSFQATEAARQRNLVDDILEQLEGDAGLAQAKRDSKAIPRIYPGIDLKVERAIDNIKKNPTNDLFQVGQDRSSIEPLVDNFFEGPLDEEGPIFEPIDLNIAFGDLAEGDVSAILDIKSDFGTHADVLAGRAREVSDVPVQPIDRLELLRSNPDFARLSAQNPAAAAQMMKVFDQSSKAESPEGKFDNDARNLGQKYGATIERQFRKNKKEVEAAKAKSKNQSPAARKFFELEAARKSMSPEMFKKFKTAMIESDVKDPVLLEGIADKQALFILGAAGYKKYLKEKQRIKDKEPISELALLKIEKENIGLQLARLSVMDLDGENVPKVVEQELRAFKALKVDPDGMDKLLTRLALVKHGGFGEALAKMLGFREAKTLIDVLKFVDGKLVPFLISPEKLAKMPTNEDGTLKDYYPLSAKAPQGIETITVPDGKGGSTLKFATTAQVIADAEKYPNALDRKLTPADNSLSSKTTIHPDGRIVTEFTLGGADKEAPPNRDFKVLMDQIFTTLAELDVLVQDPSNRHIFAFSGMLFSALNFMSDQFGVLTSQERELFVQAYNKSRNFFLKFLRQEGGKFSKIDQDLVNAMLPSPLKLGEGQRTVQIKTQKLLGTAILAFLPAFTGAELQKRRFAERVGITPDILFNLVYDKLGLRTLTDLVAAETFRKLYGGISKDMIINLIKKRGQVVGNLILDRVIRGSELLGPPEPGTTVVQSAPPKQKKHDGKSSFAPLTDEIVGITSEGRNIYLREDGTRSSETSVVMELDNKHFNFPLIYNGKQLSPKEAFDIIISNGFVDPETGRQIVGFDSPEAADADRRKSFSKVKMRRRIKAQTGNPAPGLTRN